MAEKGQVLLVYLLFSRTIGREQMIKRKRDSGRYLGTSILVLSEIFGLIDMGEEENLQRSFGVGVVVVLVLLTPALASHL